MKCEILTLKQQFIVIDSEVDFQLVANPLVEYIAGVPQFPADGNLRGTDYCSRRAGAWQVNAWKLLGKQDFPLRPVFTLALVYDDSTSPVVKVQYSDINLGEGLAGLNGQLVTIDPRDFAPVVSAISDSIVSQTSAISDSIVSQTSAISDSIVSQTSAISDSIQEFKSVISSSFNPSVFVNGSFSLDFSTVGESVTFLGGGSLVASLPSSRRYYYLEALGFSMIGFTGSTSYLGLSKGDSIILDLEPSGLFVTSFCSVAAGGGSTISFDVSKRDFFSFDVSSSNFVSEFAFFQPGFFRLFRFS